MGLSKEEKKAKKEAKRLEKLRAEQELKKKLKREELQRELAAHAIRRGELDKSWRKMMLKIKEPVFRQDIEVMWHTFERALDKKENVIQQTMKLLDLADDQFQRTVASFCDTIDTMIKNFLAELEKLSKENDIHTANRLKSGEDEFSKIMTDHDAAETHLQLLLYHGSTTADSKAWTTRGEYLVKEDEERVKYVNERDNLRSFLENAYSNMWDDYKSVLKAYVLNTADNQKKVRRLRQKENIMADIIATQAKKIENNDGVLKRLRNELAAYESGTKQAAFRERRNRYRDAYHTMKKNLINDCATDEKQMATLVRESDGAMEWLEAGYNKGEKILRLAALCRKYETQREKVLPFACTILPEVEQNKINLKSHQSDDSLVTNFISSSNGLTRLWHKISNADISKRALLQEKKLLEKENALLSKKLQQYNDPSFVPDIQECVCVPLKKRDLDKPVAIEAVLELNKYKHS